MSSVSELKRGPQALTVLYYIDRTVRESNVFILRSSFSSLNPISRLSDCHPAFNLMFTNSNKLLVTQATQVIWIYMFTIWLYMLIPWKKKKIFKISWTLAPWAVISYNNTYVAMHLVDLHLLWRYKRKYEFYTFFFCGHID